MAQEVIPPPPPLPPNRSVVVCIKIANSGAVSGAFLVTSTGDPAYDRMVLNMAKQLRYPPTQPGDVAPSGWRPIPMTFETTRLPAMPATCQPASRKPARSR